MLKVDPATAAHHRRYPSISLLVPLAGATPWPARLARLRRDAIGRLRAEFGAGVDATLLDRLADTVDSAAAPPGARSLAVYVNTDRCSVVGLGVDVRERVVIDDTFATRDLLATDLRQPRYWVLALNLADPQLLHGHGGRLHPSPLELNDTTPHSSGRAGRGRDRDAMNDARRTRRLRAIDMAVGPALSSNHEPVLVVGPEPTLSRFLDRTRHAHRIEGIVRRAPDAHLDALAATVAPSVAQMLAERRLDALEHLDRAVSNGTAASGIEPVWRAARRQPGLLLVEHAFERAASITTGGRLEPAADSAAPGVLDDAVDEIIERVLSSGGRVELLPDGLIAHHQRIAFVPWQRRRRR